jgi:hypothetical protein
MVSHICQRLADMGHPGDWAVETSALRSETQAK